MGCLVHAEIEISNLGNAGYEPIVVRSLVDTGALHLCIPEHVAIQLGFNRASGEISSVG